MAALASREPWRGRRLQALMSGEEVEEPPRMRRTQQRGETFGERMSYTLRQIDKIERGIGTMLTLSNFNLTDITDIPGVVSALRNITILYCNDNKITDLPDLRKVAPRLEHLYCFNNQLTSLPPLPDTLIGLYCENNLLTSLENLPRRLSKLSCSNNLLRALPRPLPSNLIDLWCSKNQLIYLPKLPFRLEILNCDRNQLKVLPQLPRTLQRLACYENNLTFLPILPLSINFLVIHTNPFHEPFTPYREKKGEGVLSIADINNLIPLTKDYWDHQTVETLGPEMVNPESRLSAGLGQPDRLGYGFPSGPDANILGFLGIRKGKEGFDEARERLRTKMNPNPLAEVNSSLFTGGKRYHKTKRSKKPGRHTRRK